MDELKILLSAGLKKSNQKSINEELKKLKLTSLKVGVQLVQNVQSSINNQLKNLKLKPVDVAVNVNSKSIKDALKNTSSKTSGKSAVANEIFDVDKLKSEGRKFYLSATNIIDRIKKDADFAGSDINIIDTRNAKKQLTGFQIEIRKATGEIEKLNFEKAKFTKEGWKTQQSGFVFTGMRDTDKLLGGDMQKKLDILNRMENRLKDIRQKAYDLTKPLTDVTHVETLDKKYAAITAEINKVRTSGDAMSKEQQRNIGNMIADAERYRKEMQRQEYPGTKLDPTSLSNNIDKHKADLMTLEKRWKNQGILLGDFQKRVEALKAEISAVGSTDDLHKFEHNLDLTNAEAKQLLLTLRQFDAETARKTNLNQLETYLKANPKVLKASREEVDALREAMSRIDNPTDNANVGRQFRLLKSEMENLQKTGNTVFGSLIQNSKKFVSWLIASGAIMSAIQTLRQMINHVIDLDTQMTALRKVTDETSDTYARFFNGAADSAQKLGTTLSALIKSTSDFAKLGYGLEDAKALAEVANIYQNVGDIDINSAIESIISTLKAFNINAKESISIVDKFNEVNKPAPLRLVA